MHVHAGGFTAGQKPVENQDLATEPSRAVGCGSAFSKPLLIIDINKGILKYISHPQRKEQSSLVIQSLATYQEKRLNIDNNRALF